MEWQPYTLAKVGDHVRFKILTATMPEDVGEFAGEIISQLGGNEFIVKRKDGSNFAVKQLGPAEFFGARGRLQ